MKSRYLSLVFLATTLAGVAAAGAMAPRKRLMLHAPSSAPYL
jgi:hypothetical protein